MGPSPPVRRQTFAVRRVAPRRPRAILVFRFAREASVSTRAGRADQQQHLPAFDGSSLRPRASGHRPPMTCRDCGLSSVSPEFTSMSSPGFNSESSDNDLPPPCRLLRRVSRAAGCPGEAAAMSSGRELTGSHKKAPPMPGSANRSSTVAPSMPGPPRTSWSRSPWPTL